MKSWKMLTLVGEDQPSIVAKVTQTLYRGGWNLGEASMIRLGGSFSIMMMVPDFTGNVIRATHVEVKAQDLLGAPLEYEMEGFEARALQHELDHLDGMLFINRVVSRRTDLFRRKVYQKGSAAKANKEKG